MHSEIADIVTYCCKTLQWHRTTCLVTLQMLQHIVYPHFTFIVMYCDVSRYINIKMSICFTDIAIYLQRVSYLCNIARKCKHKRYLYLNPWGVIPQLSFDPSSISHYSLRYRLLFTSLQNSRVNRSVQCVRACVGHPLKFITYIWAPSRLV